MARAPALREMLRTGGNCLRRAEAATSWMLICCSCWLHAWPRKRAILAPVQSFLLIHPALLAASARTIAGPHQCGSDNPVLNSAFEGCGKLVESAGSVTKSARPLFPCLIPKLLWIQHLGEDNLRAWRKIETIAWWR
jgi:hypothetical protein